MRRVVLFGILFVLATTIMTFVPVIAQSPAPTPQTPRPSATSCPSYQEIIGMLRNRHARDVMEQLYQIVEGPDGTRTTPCWDAVCNGIETGDRHWLIVSLLLGPGIGEATAVDLENSQSEALEKAPIAVLTLFGPTTCYISDHHYGTTPAEFERVVKRRIDVVSAIRSDELKSDVAECVKILQESLERARQFFETKK